MTRFFRNLSVLIVLCVATSAVSVGNILRYRSQIVSIEEVRPAQVVIVLGAKVKANGEPSDILRDRLLTAIEVYRKGMVEKILVSGDDGQVEYDEVNAMRVYLRAAGVDADDIFLDHAGFDTYDSMIRAAKVFGATRAIVVTQEYHLPRALYLADAFGIDAQGVAADRQTYRGMLRYQIRELLADVKATINVLFHASPHFFGDAIDITADGRTTWDEGYE